MHRNSQKCTEFYEYSQKLTKNGVHPVHPVIRSKPICLPPGTPRSQGKEYVFAYDVKIDNDGLSLPGGLCDLSG